MVVRAQGAGEAGGQPQGPGWSRWGRGGRRQGPSKGPSRFLTDSVAAGGDPSPGCAPLLVCPAGRPATASRGPAWQRRGRLPASPPCRSRGHASVRPASRCAGCLGHLFGCLDEAWLVLRARRRKADENCPRPWRGTGRVRNMCQTGTARGWGGLLCPGHGLWHSACGFHGQPADSGWACLSVRHLSRRQARGLFGGGPDVVCLAAALRASECPLSRGLLSYPKSFPRVGSAPRFPCPRWPWRPGTRSPGGCSALFTDRGAVKCDN